MTRGFRNASAALLMVAIAAVPALLDRCAEGCAAHPAAAASTPACHHAIASGTRIGHVPPRCSHDHNGAVVVAIKIGALNPTSSAPLAVTASAAVLVRPSTQDLRLSHHAPPGAVPALETHSLPLRI